MNDVPPFDPNDYRKRVLAAVERRGGPDTSDPFELYDLPLDKELSGELDDTAVAERVAEVWAFWQRQRDHPRYRALVALLVETHAARSAELLDADTRRAAATRARAHREEREAARYALLDAAISRLVQRHGGVPRDKVAGLEEVGALGGLTKDEVATRVRRHRVLGASIGPERRRQIQALLAEFGRLTGAAAPPTLLALLGLVPSATEQQVNAGWTAWRARARELPSGRLRAVVDELLVHVSELLVPGRSAVETYLDAVAADVTEYLRPRVRAAVLVEDRLVADDHAHVLDEAAECGLDGRRAAAVVAELAAELGAVVEPVPGSAETGGGPAGGRAGGEGGTGWPDGAGGAAGGRAGAAGAEGGTGWPDGAGGDAGGRAGAAGSEGGRPRDPGRAGGTGWPGGPTTGAERAADRAGAPAVAPDLLRRARAALRAGRPREARELVAAAAAAATGSVAGQARALADEVATVLADAERRVGEAAAAAADRRWVAAAAELDDLARTAADVVPDLDERRSRARDEVVRAGERFAAALAGPDAGREAALREVLAACGDHDGARRALEELAVAPPDPPAWVNAARDLRGDVVVLWAPSTALGVTYRVRRMRPDGTWQVVGRVTDSSIEDGGAPPGVETPVYAVSAIQAGRTSPETRSDSAAATPGPAAPAGVLAVRAGDGTVDVTWTPVADDVEYRVRRLDGARWQVVGRTRATRLQDGGAPAGTVPVYAVSAARGGVRSAEGRSDGS